MSGVAEVTADLDRLACELAKNTKPVVKDELVFRFFANSLVYEPTRAGYMHQQPATLDSYLEHFKAAILTIIDDGQHVATIEGGPLYGRYSARPSSRICHGAVYLEDSSTQTMLMAIKY
jgi:hypothetical protein